MPASTTRASATGPGAPPLLERLAAAGLRAGLVVDLGCGPGGLARAVMDAGYRVLGADPSEAMLALARERVPGADLRRVAAADLAPPECVAVTAVGEVLGSLPDPRAGPEALRIVAGAARRALVPGGVLLLDLAGPGRGPEEPVASRFQGEGWSMTTTVREDPPGAVLVGDIVVTVHDDGGRSAREVHRLRPVPPAEVLAVLEGLDVAVEVLDRYGDVRLPPGLTAVAARSPVR